MEESQSNQDRSRFGALVDKVSGSVRRSAGNMEFHQRSGGAEDARGYNLNGRRSALSEFATHDTSMVGRNQHFQGFSHDGSLHDEQSLISAFEDMALSAYAADSPTDLHNAALTNGNYLSGHGDITLNQPPVSTTHQDEYIPLQFSASYANQRSDQLAFEHGQQAYGFPPHMESFSKSSRQPNSDSILKVPYQLRCYFDGQSTMCTSYDEPAGSSFIPRHGTDVQPYSVMHPHSGYPPMQHVSGLDVARTRKINTLDSVSAPANGASSYPGIANFHWLEYGNPYLNGATIQKSNGRLDSTFADRFPRTSYIDGSCGSSDFCQFRQQEKVAHPYGPGFSQHRITGHSTMSYPERILMRPDNVSLVRSVKFAPPANGCTGMDKRINGFEYNHLDIQSDDSVKLEWLKHQILFSKYASESAMASRQRTSSSVDEVAGRICTVAKDQNGCRFLQKVFTEGTPEDAQKVFAEIIDHIGEIMVDPFAHYLVQKILEECSNDQRMRIICEITKAPIDFLEVSCNMHGTRVVQKVIETINTPEQALKVVSALSPGAARLMTDPNGSHVVHRCLQKLLPEHKAFLLDVAASRHLQLARDRHGCCVLQKCIEHANDDQKNNMLNNITSGALSLSEDQYGNYVIQFILSLKIEWATSRIVDELDGHFGNLSMQKCGSHVVEQCLKLAPPAVCDRIINELMNDPKLPHIMIDQYGNYVIQTALKESKGTQHTALVEAIKLHTATLQSNIFGQRVLSRTHMKNKHYRNAMF